MESTYNFTQMLGLNPVNVYPDSHVAGLLRVGDRRRLRAIRWLRRNGKIIENGRHPLAKGVDWLEALEKV